MARVLVVVAVALASAASAQPVRTVPFEEAVAIARAHVHAVAVAEIGLLTAQVDVAAIRDERWPSLSVAGGAGQRYGLAFDQTAGALTQTRIEAVDVNLNASYTVFDGFERRARRQAATATVHAATANVERARQRAVAEVVAGYLAVSQAQAEAVIAAAALDAQLGLEAQVEVLVASGVRPPFEADLQREQLGTAQARVVVADREWALANARLVRLLELDPNETYDFPSAPVVVALPDSLAARTLLARPDLRAAESAARAARAERRAAAAPRLPHVALVGSVGTNYTSANAVSVFGQLDDHRAGALGFRVTVPILDRGIARRSIDQAAARVAVRDREVADLRRDIVLEVEELQIELAALEALRDAAGARLDALDAALAAEDTRYRAGATTFQSVADVRARRVGALTEQARLEVAIRFQRVSLAMLARGD